MTMIGFSLGYNFDKAVIAEIAALNATATVGQVREIYAATSAGKVPSARPRLRIPGVDWHDLVGHVEEATKAGLTFNYLLNTAHIPTRVELAEEVSRIRDCGIALITVGTPKLALMIREIAPDLRLILSLTYRVQSVAQVIDAEQCGVEAVYLDAVTINRDFPSLRELIAVGTIAKRLYANVSCIAGCPVIDAHYGVFRGADPARERATNDRFFAGCSYVKAKSALEWMQMPWIRPEDVGAYHAEGVGHFKLSDRLASSATLVRIARAYLSGRSPSNLFSLIERDGAKLRAIWGDEVDSALVSSKHIPATFIEHFKSGACRSLDADCDTCRMATERAIWRHGNWPRVRALAETPAVDAPRALQKRANAL